LKIREKSMMSQQIVIGGQVRSLGLLSCNAGWMPNCARPNIAATEFFTARESWGASGFTALPSDGPSCTSDCAHTTVQASQADVQACLH
jgi:hypothetical protein